MAFYNDYSFWTIGEAITTAIEAIGLESIGPTVTSQVVALDAELAANSEGARLKILPESTKGILLPPREDNNHYGILAAIAGTSGHTRRAASVKLGYDDARLWAQGHYHDPRIPRPRYYEELSALGEVASMIIDDLQTPQDEEALITIADGHWRDNRNSVASAITLKELLDDEQRDATSGQRHPLAAALRACGFFKTHTDTDEPGKGFGRLVAELPNSEQIVGLTRTARTHYITGSGKLIMSQNATPDELTATHEADDTYAAQVSHAFMQVLRSKYVLDPDVMSQMKFVILPADVRDDAVMTMGEREHHIKNGNEVIAAFVDLLMQDRVHCTLHELKFSTGLDETPKTDKIWERHHYDLRTVLLNAYFQTGNNEYKQTHKRLHSWESDAIKTKGVLRNIVRVALMEYFKNAGSRGSDIGSFRPESAPELADIMGRFALGLYVARMDLRNGWYLPPNDPGARDLGYTLDHPLRTVRVPFPKDIQVVDLPIHDLTVRDKTAQWEDELYDAVRTGKIPTYNQSGHGPKLLQYPRTTSFV